MATTMRQAIACVRNVLDRKGYNYRFDADKNKFTMGFNLNRTKLKSCDIVVYVRPISGEENYCRALLAYGNIAISADKSSMAQVCEYLTRANYGLTVGNFELDHRDGEIRYKVSINVRDDLPGEDAVDDLWAIPVGMFNKYGDGLLAVNMGFSDAEDAIRMAEQ